MTDNESNTIVPSTPSWMANQRQRRQNRRGYGRRFSGVGSGSGAAATAGIFSTATTSRTAATARSGGSTPNFDDGEDIIDRSANARLEGRRPPRPTNNNSGGEDILYPASDGLDHSAHARLESRSSKFDLTDEFEHMSKPKKKRPNLPRPPPRAARGAAVTKKSFTSQFATPRVESLVIELETSASSSSSPKSTKSVAADGSHDNPISLLEDNEVAARGGSAKRSKIMYRRSNSTTGALPSPLFEENVHPNDTDVTAADTNLSSSVGTRRSSRLEKKKAKNNDGNDNETTAFITTRSRAKANSKKRSATSATSDANGGLGTPSEQQPQRSPPAMRSASMTSASMTSFSSESFSSSNSSIRNSAGSSCIGSESFSSLARRSSGKNWASSKGSSKKIHPQHKRSLSVASFPASNNGNSGASNAALKTPSSNNSTHRRSITFGGDPASNNGTNSGTSSAALKTPSSNNSMHRRSITFGGDLTDMKSSGGNSILGLQSFLSPEGGGTHLSTPSVGSTSSRKRRMDFTSSPLNEEELLGSSERSRYRKSPPVPFMMNHHAISELAPTTLRRGSSEPASRTMGLFSPPLKSSSGKSLTSGMCLLGSDDDADEKKDDVGDRLSTVNDDSMMSNESDDDGSTHSSSTSEEEDDEGAEEDETPREMTDTEVFESKSSYDDFKFLTKSLQKWSQSSHGKGHASMGLNNGCLIAVPPSWPFEHRANFAKWVATAFGFRVGSVGGAGCGSFLRCSDAEGKETLARLRRILNDFKADRLILSSGGGTNDVASRKSQDSRNNEARSRHEKPKSKRQSFSLSKKVATLSMSPFCDDFVGDLLADGMKGVTLDEKKPVKSNARNSSSVPHFIRSMTLQPLANKIKNTTLPCFRSSSPTVGENGHRSSGGGPRLSSESAITGSDFMNQLNGIKNTALPCFRSSSPTVENGRKSSGGGGRRLLRLSSESATNGSDFMNQLHGIKNTALPRFCSNSPAVENGRKSSGGGGRRLLRLSSDSAINGSDFMNQLHGMGSPSPLPNRFPRRLRERASRALQPVARNLESIGRCSFDRPSCQQHHEQGCLKPFESPHPRTSLALVETPCSRLEIGLATPMPKQLENWGSRPVFGKDWGVSSCCCDGTIDACSQILAKSWFTSEFYGNEDLSAQYRMTLDEGDEAYLFAFYDADVNVDDDDDDDDTVVASVNRESLDEFPTEFPIESPDFMSKKIGFARCDSVGASALDLLHLDDKVKHLSPIFDRRRTMKLRTYRRMSLCVAVASDFLQPKLKRCYRLSESPSTKQSLLEGTHIKSIVDSTAFSRALSFLNEGELIHSASLVCTTWADAAAEALGNLMLVSVGCDPSVNDKTNDDCSSEADESDFVDTQAVPPENSSVAKSMERGWPYLMERFPWAKFLSDGSFKRVYKVWNDYCGAYEAISVMDVDAINDLGNLNLVGTELAVSVLLSSVARRNICPNFVITRGVFTCQHEPPAPLWGCKDDAAPRGTSYDGHTQTPTCRAPKPDQCGNYQYIRMELCQHGDIEEFIKNHPQKMLAPLDCRNLLFQMAFALHVAGDRFGLKHYDVKLLNFFLQSAKDVTIAEEEHPHVVLRYGVGSHVFRLRMHPSSAHIAKLADYGTSVMRTDTDGQPVSLGQFTTLENTPPDYLILGNAAEQGYGHDCFGLGLCMLHLFTGHGPYEEILDAVVCPENLKGKLRKIWKQKPHDVIRSVILDNDENGMEIEDQTLYDTLYRFLVLFGIPEKQFDIKTHGKVWRAINSTLLPSKGPRSKKCPDMDVFNKDRNKFSLADGTDKRIVDARRRLLEINGGMELLLSLVSFDPKTRATPLDVINSRFMGDLIEEDGIFYGEDDIVKSYTSYLTN